MNEKQLADIAHITQFAEHTTPFWQSLKPKVFHKNGEAYGMIATREIRGTTYLTAMTAKPNIPFTKSMIAYIKNMYDTIPLCLILDVQSEQERIVTTLERYNPRYALQDNILYAYNNIRA